MRALFVGFRCVDSGLDVPLFLRGRQFGFEPECVEPKLPTPAFGVVKMLVFLFFYLLVAILEACRLV